VPEALREVLEEIEFYISQEMLEEAQSTLSDALASFPGHPLLLARQLELSEGGAGGSSPAPSMPSSRPSAGPASSPALRSEPPASRGSAREDRSFELAQKLADEVLPVAAHASPQAPIEVADVLAQFKQGVAKQVDKADAATHYDLGIAYMEMGLHGEAIEEFKLTLVDPLRRCNAHTMIGLSYVASGDMDLGVEHLRHALQEKPRPEEELGLWFELGNAFELVGKNLDALGWYEKVEARDPQFRDVSVRIQRLNVARTPEQEADEFDEMFDNMIVKE
jgi:tetratricopeptide (TPR) repeat protein